MFDCSLTQLRARCHLFFFFNDTATTEIYTLSLHDALPILDTGRGAHVHEMPAVVAIQLGPAEWVPNGARVLQLEAHQDRKSTRLNSSHSQISYAVFCLKK